MIPLLTFTRTPIEECGAKHYEDFGETLCPPDRAGIADVTRRVAAESSFALAKGNVKGDSIPETPIKLMIPASRWSCCRYMMRHATKRENSNATALIYRCPMARHPCPTSQHLVTSSKRATARHHPRCLTSHYKEIQSPFDTPTALPLPGSSPTFGATENTPSRQTSVLLT